ncbi:putative bifunctional diguanylate cyclase/phosphodiesterase [Novosphingobium soli]|uniref:Bifunctional diguanylate cyclase/phosphodiesterase n=1 Tax=Novosphingobium soli TaxID=574956 RepID=A0ABV6CVP8_9SPHN
MTPSSPARQALPQDLPALAVLGALHDPASRRSAPLRMLAQAAAALATVVLLYGRVPTLAVLAWIALAAAAQVYAWRVDRALAAADTRRLSPPEARHPVAAALAAGIAWALPLAGFGSFVDGQTQVKLWAVLTMLTTVSAILPAAVPIATLVFSCVAGGSAAAFFLISGHWDTAAIALLSLLALVFATVDSTRRRIAAGRAEAAMAEKDEVVSLLLREFEEGEADWLWQVDPARRVRSVSPRFAFALGRQAAQAEGQPLVQLIAGSAWDTGVFPPSLRELAERLKRREHFSNLLVRVEIGGQTRWWELSGTPRIDEQGLFQGFRGVGSDVTEARENSDKIAWLARYDTLTGLPNRLMLTETLASALDHAAKWRTRCALLMIDLDRFKAVNETLGHHVGDQLLARVSERLKAEMSEDALCGRLGGDEFAVVLRDAAGPDAVERVARRVIERLSEPYEVDGHTLFVGVSVGSAVGPRDGATAEKIMRNADLALYRSKDVGGNVHCTYEPVLHAHADERRKLEAALRRALGRGEMRMAYQPVVDAGTEGVVGFEALLRWDSADHGSVSPAKFIPLAEDTRLIVPIGEWVLREACREATNWPAHVRIAVNVSGEQLHDGNFASTVANALTSTGLPPHRLEIEVTESVFLRDDAPARAALDQVIALGCGVALDDFGTGYSSLGYLRRMRFSTIKIDRSFVQGAAAGNRESLAIIRAIVAMADSLGMSTTAEGAETEKEVEIIRQLGCRKIQGYLFGRPMTGRDAQVLFRERALPSGQSAA